MTNVNFFDVNTMSLKELDQEFRRLKKRLFDIQFQIEWQKSLNQNLAPELIVEKQKIMKNIGLIQKQRILLAK